LIPEVAVPVARAVSEGLMRHPSGLDVRRPVFCIRPEVCRASEKMWDFGENVLAAVMSQPVADL
jgi:hypothetical protein